MLISIPTKNDLEKILSNIATKIDKTESQFYSSKPFKFLEKKINDGLRMRKELAGFEFVNEKNKKYLRAEYLDEILKNSTLYVCTAILCTPLHLAFPVVPLTSMVVGVEYMNHLKKYKEEGNRFMILNQLNPLNLVATYFLSGIGYLAVSLISAPLPELIVNYKEAKKFYTYRFKSVAAHNQDERKAIAEKIYSADKPNSAPPHTHQNDLRQAFLHRQRGY
jgi:hypothetical protein